MNTRISNRIVSFLLCLVMLVGMVPTTVMAEHTPIAPAVDSTTTEYSVPSGSTLTLETYEHGFDSNYGLGKDYLFVIKKDGKYYAMQEMSVSEEPFDTIAAVEVTDWVAADGKSVTIPADPGNVAFIRMDLVKRVNGNACLGYSMTRVWDEGYDNILSETMRFTAQSADASGSSMLWQTTPDNYSGTFYQYSRRSINYKNYYVDYAVDLREDGNGGYEFYWRTINDEALEYDAWQTQQEQGFGVEGYLFSGACRHQSKIDHTAYDAPTCMDKGCAEYWFCHGCERYFKDAALTQLHKAYLIPDGYFEPILAATGHDWGTNGCNNCGLATPVYTKITTMEQLSALGDNASFILVAQYGGKTYVLDGGDPEALAKRIDANGDMYEDIIEIDNNNNGTPDCLEIDEDSNGVWDYLETDLVNNDGIVDWYDYYDYWYNMDFGGLFDNVYSANAYEGGIMGAIEVTPHADGTINLSNDHILCFELTQMLSDEDIEMNLGFELEYNPDMTEEEQEAYRQGLKSNLMMKLPNLWLQPYFCWTNRAYMEDRPMYGDQTTWRFYFYDDIKDKTIEVEEYDYDLGDYVIKEVSVLPEDFETTAFSLSEGSVLIYSTHDMFGGLQNARENLHNSIRLRDVDDTIDFVGGSSVMDPETYEYIELNGGTQVSIYLYASDVSPAHTCDFGDWVDDEVTETHTRTCKDATCGKTETKNHSWDSGVQNGTPSCTEGAEIVYTCTGCGKTKSEAVDNLGHDWSDWKDDGANATTDTHSHTCNRNCGVAAESEPHSWGNWTPDGDTNHKKTCSICSGTRTDTHKWDDGVITTQPTEDAEGVKTYTCSDCGHTKTEPVDKLEHVHSWSDWGQNNETTHIRSCRCNETQTAGHNFDDGVVINWPTHLAPGEIHYTCTDCGYVKIGTQPALEEHEWSDWSYNNDDKTHTRSCICNETETKDCSWDAGVVTKQPTHYEEGVKTYTCSVCSGTKTEAIAKTTEHEWSDWSDNNDGTHTRSCRCNANETKDCTYDSGVVTEQPTHTEKGIKTYTCTVCGHTYTEDIPVLTDHAWGEWMINKLDEANTHIRYCVCDESQTAPHNFDDGKVTTEATHTSKGVKTFTCTDGCGYSYTEEIPETTEHQWTDWSPNGDGTHTRSCRCNANETKDCTYDAGVVTTPSTHYEEGVKTFTCTVCGHTKTEAIAKTTEHEWSDWSDNKDGTHTRSCRCNANETLAHTWGSWAVQNDGGYKRECADCGAFETMTLPENKPVNTTTNDNVANTNLTNTDIELIENVLTDEEQSQVAEGAEVKVYLKVEDISNAAPAEHKEEAEAKAGNDEIGMYLDIDLFKQVGTAAETPVTETSGKVAITITIPENLINTDASITRTYKIIRVHEEANGQLITDVIEGVFNPDDNSFTFETDKFSTYALAYADSTVPSNPQTGDNSMMALWIVLICVSGLGLVATMAYRKKRMF